MAWDNIVKFPAAKSETRLPHASSAERRDGRTLRCNPLRATFVPISPAVTIVGKMQTAENRDIGALSKLGKHFRERWLERLRAGAAAARIVAKELDFAAERLVQAQAEVDAMTTEEFREAYLQLSPEEQQEVSDRLRAMLEPKP